MAKTKKTSTNYLDKLEQEVESNQSKLSLVLGGLIIIVLAVLVFNYFNKPKSEVGPSQQTENPEDVSPESLPGKYTVKEGDTLFTIAEKYYLDGYKYSEIVKENSLADENTIEVGQVLQIPAIGGGNTTIWGPKIDGDSYMVEEGDWLSTISARAYGDIMSYTKIAEANSITNPDLIEPGQILKIPR